MYGDLTITQAFSKADDILCTAARGIAEIITKPGQINVDFMDVQTAMKDSGRAIMGTGFASGDNRAENAVRMALDSPLLDNTRIQGARHLLVNFAYGHKEPVMSEISKVKKFLQEEAGHTAHLKMGITRDESLGEDIAITVIATGFEVKSFGSNYNLQETAVQQQPVAQNIPVTPSHPVNNPYQPNYYGGQGFHQAPPAGSMQPNLFSAPPSNPTVVNHVPQQIDNNEDSAMANNTFGQEPMPFDHNQNSHFSNPNGHFANPNNHIANPANPLNPMNIEPKAFESSSEWNEDPMSQIFRDTRMENGRRDREALFENDIEVPAYMRKGISLEAAPPSQSQLVSKITIGEEDPMNARDLTVKPNRHLHDNVD
jgi:cell division protein FtsZ